MDPMPPLSNQPRVELLCLTQRAPLLLQGSLDNTEDGNWIFTSDSVIPIEVNGFRAIINYKDGQTDMITLRIQSQHADKLYLSDTNAHPREKRLFPRMFGLVPLQLKVIHHDAEIVDWLNGNLKVDDSWIRPEPFMNFSVNGVAFHMIEPLPLNGTVLFVCTLENEALQGLAKVVRCVKDDSRYEIALYFEQIPEKMANYLSDMTLRLQDSFL